MAHGVQGKSSEDIPKAMSPEWATESSSARSHKGPCQQGQGLPSIQDTRA